MLQDKAVQHILDNPGSNVNDIIGAVGCHKSVAYAALSAISAIKEIKSNQRIVGIIADTHEPACHPDYFDFVCDTFDRFGVTEVVHIGDVVDNHALSRHVSEPDADNSLTELNKAIKSLKKWTSYFQNVKVCTGNHDRIIIRQNKTLNIPDIYLKSMNEVLELPDTWRYADHWEIDDVWYEHGIGSTGMYGCKNTSLKYGMNYVQGHTHAHAGVLHMSSPKRNTWAMNVGCGCDSNHLQMRYGKIYKFKPTIGCGIVIDGKNGIFCPMDFT